jgi:RimJ/RimL family protein N-acetyltransferase
MSTPQPLGERVEFRGARVPGPTPLTGRSVELLPLDPERDAGPLYSVSHAPTGDPTVWTYLYEAPFPDVDAYRDWLIRAAASKDPLFFAVMVDGRALGVMSYLAITPDHGSIEIGNIWFAPEVQRSRVTTEATYLLARHAFDDLGYRRLEWKCNALNAPSRRAAERFGFVYEGTFAQHKVVKGRNRDTAWFAITDQRWPTVRAAFERWLAPTNFDAAGQQLRSLGSEA